MNRRLKILNAKDKDELRIKTIIIANCFPVFKDTFENVDINNA